MEYVGIYLRTATSGEGLAGQLNSCLTYATEHGFTVEAVYHDTGSSSKPREGYYALLEDLANDEISAVIVYSLDRIARSEDNLSQYFDACGDIATHVVSSDWVIDPSKVHGDSVGQLVTMLAEYEAAARAVVTQ